MMFVFTLGLVSCGGNQTKEQDVEVVTDSSTVSETISVETDSTVVSETEVQE